MKSYLVCATQRSGSTLLCEALKATGVAGRPEEFFEARPATGIPPEPLDYLDGIDDPYVTGLLAGAPPPPAPPYSALAGVDGWEEHLARSLRDGTTANGVFGAKVMWNQLADIRTLAGRDAEPLALLQDLLGPTHWVWVRRRDVLRQAVSLWRALQTQTWREAGAEQPTAVYSRAAIAHLTALLADHDAAWGAFFSEHGLRPLELVYEDYARDIPGAVAAVLAHLGVSEGVSIAAEPPMKRQSDGISDEWAEAYRRGIAVRPHNTPHPLSHPE
ncbi:MAG: trehalose 2-sulfotransferase [Solirubrobacteraceae bacterium]|nr:trehalose 2-sulfotransferase [Solirubrobacteraceae bacterium]